MAESHLVIKVRCPECARLGKDRNSDNFAVYSDGHKHCFSCGYTVSVNKVISFKREDIPSSVTDTSTIFLPSDSCTVYPDRAVKWMEQYELTRIDMMNHNVVWSDMYQRLIFPIYGSIGLLAWQGRSFSLDNMAVAKIAKWYTKGNIGDVMHILGKGDRIVLTEDIVSAIKVSKCCVKAMPLFGSFVGVTRFKRLYVLFGNNFEVALWLDPDKRKEALKETKLGRVHGLVTRIIFSDKDPKEHSWQDIKNIISYRGI
jgi:hypothetical protein